MATHSIYRTTNPVVLTGQYGSGKTEIAVNLAINKKAATKNAAIIDLDIANPYFRSREMSGVFREMGIELISNAYGYDIAADLPALSPLVGRYLTNRTAGCVVDVGGNDSGARVLNQYKRQLGASNADFYIVVNVYRPETDNVQKIVGMIDSIQKETGQRINGIINNSNLLRSTSAGHIIDSIGVVAAVSEQSGIPVVAHCCEEKFYEELSSACDAILPIKLHMRPKWLDM
jgi:RecA/RadA recombinase